MVSPSSKIEGFEYRCQCGPETAPFWEQHDSYSIALVRRGAFTYSSSGQTHLLTRGAFLLGNAGREYVCRHELGHGDVCLVFKMTPEALESVASEIGARGLKDDAWFSRPTLPPSARAEAVACAAGSAVSIGEAGLVLAADTLSRLTGAAPKAPTATRDHERAYAAVELIDARLEEALSLEELAAAVDLSPFHFLRVFRAAIGLTPHQYLITARIRRALTLLRDTDRPITEIGLDVGFEDLSNFIRTFRKQVGAPPSEIRRGGDRKILQVAAAAHR